MPRKHTKAGSKKAATKRVASKPAPSAPQGEENTVAQSASLGGRVIERPDGFYWERAPGEARGPYATLAEAEADMLADGVADDAEGGVSLQEAESELGISEWIDPDTGGPAEDNVPRLEDH